MGTIMAFRQLGNEEAKCSKLLVYMKAIQKMSDPKSVSKELADGLLACKPNRRSMKLEQIFNSVLDKYPDNVMIKDIDVMFNPDYKVDVLKLLIAARKRKKYSVIWPGSFEEGKLVYGEEEYPDYKTYCIVDYDITFVK